MSLHPADPIAAATELALALTARATRLYLASDGPGAEALDSAMPRGSVEDQVAELRGAMDHAGQQVEDLYANPHCRPCRGDVLSAQEDAATRWLTETQAAVDLLDAAPAVRRAA